MNMEHFITIVFWIAALSGGLQANPVPADSKITIMQTFVTCPPDSKFYTPTDVKNECITAALNCVLKEFSGTVSEECSDPHSYIDQELEFLEELIKTRPKGNDLESSECLCEKWSETPFSEFLNKTTTLIELTTTKNSS